VIDLQEATYKSKADEFEKAMKTANKVRLHALMLVGGVVAASGASASVVAHTLMHLTSPPGCGISQPSLFALRIAAQPPSHCALLPPPVTLPHHRSHAQPPQLIGDVKKQGTVIPQLLQQNKQLLAQLESRGHEMVELTKALARAETQKGRLEGLCRALRVRLGGVGVGGGLGMGVGWGCVGRVVFWGVCDRLGRVSSARGRVSQSRVPPPSIDRRRQPEAQPLPVATPRLPLPQIRPLLFRRRRRHHRTRLRQQQQREQSRRRKRRRLRDDGYFLGLGFGSR